MSHELEIIDGKACMAYAGETPWHGLGKSVSNDLTPKQMLKEAGLDWRVEKVPAYAMINGEQAQIDTQALVRSSDGKILTEVSSDWEPTQNEDAFEFFSEFVAEAGMEMDTAGSLHGGRNVWALGKIKESFTVFKKDRVDAYLLFSNPHKYGASIDIRFTPVRVVCNNTLQLSLSTKNSANAAVRVSHRKKFDAKKVKETLGIASYKLNKYKEMAIHLGNEKYNNENIVEYFKRVFPALGEKGKKNEQSLNAKRAMDFLETQPGAEYAAGTWWQAFNSATFMVDHVIGRNDDNRLNSAWFGAGAGVKQNALGLALRYAG